MASKVTVDSVAGIVQKARRKLFARHREALRHKVGTAVDAWLDGAFVGVDYPRDSFGAAFTTFTPAAEREARRRQRLMTNWPLRHAIDGVTTVRRNVSLDVLAPGGHAAGVTARVALAFTTSGHATKRVTVRGRLLLTRNDKGDWRIFGFDISKGQR
jgi:hypothetical protein